MENFGKKLEMFANIAIIAVAITLIGTIGYNYFGSKKTTPDGIKVGEKVSLADTNWTAKDQTLVLVLQKNCHFCQESMNFYKTLTQTAQSKGNIQTVAVFPTSADESAQYLAQQGVKVDAVKQAGLADVNVRGTPTVLLVDREGKVIDSWIGKLPAEKEQELIGKL